MARVTELCEQLQKRRSENDELVKSSTTPEDVEANLCLYNLSARGQAAPCHVTTRADGR
jgi:hypothetical protein